VLDQLGVRPGDKIAVEVVGPGRIEVRAARPTADLNGFIGSLKKPGTRPLSIDEINRIIRKSWAGQKWQVS
jgi:hypothetical protein